jgi:epoxyqueuosine reductase QueG
MGRYDVTKKAKEVALSHGADLVGVVRVTDLSEHADGISGILSTAQSIMVIASKHSLASIRSANIQMAQFDTIHAYQECTRAAHNTSRFLESEGFSSVAVPAFIPIDMRDPKKGMRGEICWRRAGVRAGIGSYGENGLLITKEFGAAIRISGLVTSAELKSDQALDVDRCDHCMRCIEACPVEALTGEGKIDKKICGDHIFQYGFRYFADFMKRLNQESAAEIEDVFKGFGIRELWQTFMTGNYYYCFQCQSQCPATELPSKTVS